MATRLISQLFAFRLFIEIFNGRDMAVKLIVIYDSVRQFQ